MKEAASIGGLFHFKPSAQCRLLALNGHSSRARVCPLLDQSRQRAVLGLIGSVANDPKQTFSKNYAALAVSAIV
jgi:hypothetical protein